MESPRKFNDCYFYYYSTCTKGDNCVFRHEPSALGCETMCALWQEGKCLDKKCKYRHMELRKNRKQIPCYWENQPGGCRKKHCPFMHKNPEARTDGIAPSQPILGNPVQTQNSVGEPAQVEVMPHPGVPHPGVPHPGVAHPGQHPGGHPGVAPVPMPSVPAPVPMLWQQQRQVVLDSTILGVLPTSAELLGGRRVMPPHESNPNPYGPMPVDPLVVNFEEESDSETPSGTPTKQEGLLDTSDSTVQSHELLLLERIQAEAAAFYSYDQLPPRETPKERKLVRSNLSMKYDRLSLDELAGKKNAAGEKTTSLDFKVMSLDEIRAKKRNSLDTLVHSTSIAVNISRKRKASETIVDSANKIIKVVRSNSIVYKKVDQNGAPSTNVGKVDQKAELESKKRKVSEFCDTLDVGGDELEDDCFQFKKIKPDEIDCTRAPFIRTRSEQNDTFDDNHVEPISTEQADVSKADSDDEVQIISEEIHFGSVLDDSDVITLDDSMRIDSQSEIVNLSDDDDEDIIISDIELSFGKNVPDVVASCHSKTGKSLNDSEVLASINDIGFLDDDL